MDPEAILAAIEQQRDGEAEQPAEQERVSYLAFFLGKKCTDCRSNSSAKSRT
jgi:hypothetical protein